MNNYLTETIAIIELIFILPALLFGIVINLFRHFILGKKINKPDEEYKASDYVFSLVAWLLIGLWLLFQSQFTYITYVYACPSNSGSKCYKVKADYVPEYCESSHCDESYIEKIYFDNGGYITFKYCEMESKNKWTCYQEEDGRIWELEISEKIKVKK